MRGAKETISLEEYFRRYGAEVPPPPPVPEAGEHLVFWFRELSARRTAGFDSPNPITCTEVESWARLTNTQIRPDEVKLIFRMDEAYLSALSTVRELARKEKEPSQ